MRGMSCSASSRRIGVFPSANYHEALGRERVFWICSLVKSIRQAQCGHRDGTAQPSNKVGAALLQVSSLVSQYTSLNIFPFALNACAGNVSPLLKKSCVVFQLQQCRRHDFRARDVYVGRNRKARRFEAREDNTYEFRVDQEVRTPGCEVASAIAVMFGSSECSDALEVLGCALRARAFGLHSHRK
jgi:hypothetical protein